MACPHCAVAPVTIVDGVAYQREALSPLEADTLLDLPVPESVVEPILWFVHGFQRPRICQICGAIYCPKTVAKAPASVPAAVGEGEP